MKLNKKTIVRWKVYLDRSRVYVALAQFAMIGMVLAKSLGLEVTIPLTIILTLAFMIIAFLIGYLDMKLGIRSEEFRNLSESNPLMMEILHKLEGKKPEYQMPDLSYKGQNLSHEGLATNRLILGLTLRQVSKLTGISSSTISRIEQGKECKLSNINKLIEFYKSPENGAMIKITEAVEQELFKGDPLITDLAPTWRSIVPDSDVPQYPDVKELNTKTKEEIYEQK